MNKVVFAGREIEPSNNENDEFIGRVYADDRLLLEQRWIAMPAQSGQ